MYSLDVFGIVYISGRLSLPPREEHRARYFVFIHMAKTRGVYFSKFNENVIKVLLQSPTSCAPVAGCVL